jgi:hypothetical protein
MTKDEALQLALEALKLWLNHKLDEDTAWEAHNAIKKALQTKDDPMAWEQFHEHMAGPNYVAPQRTWVGLTDEDMNNALDYWSDDSRSAYGGAHSANGEYLDMIETWRYIEAKLKEKNQ